MGRAAFKVEDVTDSIRSVGDAAAMLRSATESIASLPPRGLTPTLGVGWSCFALLRVCAGHLVHAAPSYRHQLYYEVEVRALLAKHALDQAPSAPPLRRPFLHSWVDLGDPDRVIEAILGLTAELYPLLARESSALADHLPDRAEAELQAVDFAALDRAVLDHAVLGNTAPDHCDLDMRALGVAAAAAQLIGTDFRDHTSRGATSPDGPC